MKTYIEHNNKKVIIDSKVVFEEKVIDKELETTTYYFSCPFGWLGSEKVAADSWALSIELPNSNPVASAAIVEMSPKKDGEYFDWREIELPIEEIVALIEIAEKSNKLVLNNEISEASNCLRMICESSKTSEKNFEMEL